MKRVILILFIICLITSGCSSTKTSTEGKISNEEYLGEEKEKIENDIEDILDSSEIIISDERENDGQNGVIEKEINEGKVKSPLTGIYIEEDKINSRPIAVMIDNQYKARPQAGLSSADVVYEMLAEGNITRYLAIINTDKPNLIGPVRSARPYFIDKALEYDPYYVHVGGSPQAFADVVNLKMADIDSMSAGKSTFWRENHKPKPNNMYTSYEAIIKDANRRGYRTTSTDYETLIFNENDEDIEGKNLNNIKFPYSKGYSSEFRYNKEERIYYRYVNDKPHRDEVTDIHLSAKNIIVQYASIKVIDNEGRLEMGTVGTGKGLYITNGKMMNVTWKKNDRRDITRFYDLEGKEIKLNPGKTWYQVVPNSMKINY